LHIVQRGNNRQACFAHDADFAAYANWLFKGTTCHGVCIHAEVFVLTANMRINYFSNSWIVRDTQ